MSHFTVLVIGEDVDGQLAPYDEQIEHAPYVRGEVSEREKIGFMKYYQKNKGASGTFEEAYKEFGNDWNGKCWKKTSEGVWQEWSTYNPNSQWDWYSIGGRWSGFFKLKKGAEGQMGEKSWMNTDIHIKKGYADMALKGDIDIKGMRRLARAAAMKEYDTIASFFEDNKIPTLEHTWADVLKTFKNKKDGMEKGRDFYHSQEPMKVIQDIRENGTKKQKEAIGYFFDFEKFSCGRDEYVNRAGNSAMSTYAILKDGIWYQKGKMGWWGMSSDEMEQSEWDSKVAELIDDVDDDTMFTLVDCHI